MLKYETFKLCQEYQVISQVKAGLKHSARYEDLDHKREILEALDKLSSYLFDKIES